MATTSLSRSSIKRAAKSNTRTYQSLAASGSLVGTVTWCTPVNRGTCLFLPPRDNSSSRAGDVGQDRKARQILRLTSPRFAALTGVNLVVSGVVRQPDLVAPKE